VATSSYVALLRGINVGGKNLIKMAELKACFEQQGLRRVATYIQSGNVLFTAAAPARGELVRRIEGALAEAFQYEASVVLRTRQQLQQIIERAPEGFGDRPEKYRYDVFFLKEPLAAPAALESVQRVAVEPGVDEVHAGTGVLYGSRLISKATQSRIGKISSLPIYKQMTIRNWRTTTELLRLMEAGPELA
jgi:uncharacterized protein (DUF1697 family)